MRTRKVVAVRIADLGNQDEPYTIKSPEQAHDRVDRSAAIECFRLEDVITMGKVIAEPIFQYYES